MSRCNAGTASIKHSCQGHFGTLDSCVMLKLACGSLDYLIRKSRASYCTNSRLPNRINIEVLSPRISKTFRDNARGIFFALSFNDAIIVDELFAIVEIEITDSENFHT